MKYYVIAGEASGDLHASGLMRELKKLDSDASFRCWGGDLMKQQGGVLVKHYHELAFMGFAEVIRNLRTIMRNLRFCKQDIIDNPPDALILVDYPGFNLRIARFAREQGLKVFYYISPQVWAWKKSRVKKIRRDVDRMFVILPFEKDFYAGYGYEASFVGHPLIDVVAGASGLKGREEFIRENGLGTEPIIALLPGSRKQEISRILTRMLAVRSFFPGYQFVLAAAPSMDPAVYRNVNGATDIPILTGKTYDLLQHAHAGLVTSGTATLEAALFNVPQVVCYRGSYLSYFIARRLVDVPYISLVNLIMGRKIVEELIQGDLTPKNIRAELERILAGEERKRMLADYEELRSRLGEPGAAMRAATQIYSGMEEAVNSKQ